MRAARGVRSRALLFQQASAAETSSHRLPQWRGLGSAWLAGAWILTRQMQDLLREMFPALCLSTAMGTEQTMVPPAPWHAAHAATRTARRVGRRGGSAGGQLRPRGGVRRWSTSSRPSRATRAPRWRGMRPLGSSWSDRSPCRETPPTIRRQMTRAWCSPIRSRWRGGGQRRPRLTQQAPAAARLRASRFGSLHRPAPRPRAAAPCSWMARPRPTAPHTWKSSCRLRAAWR